jgi:hypothetical protein
VGDTLDAAAWDALRTQTDGVYSLPASREGLERKALGMGAWVRRAEAIDALLRARNAHSVASYGAGAGIIELLLLRLSPARSMVLTEYAPATVERRRNVLPEVDVVHHDLLIDRPLAADLHLFHRLDGSLSNKQWRQIFVVFRDEAILFVSSGVISGQRAWRQIRHRRDLRARGIEGGWLRTRGAYERLWRRTHSQERLWLGDVAGWWLSPRSA